MNKEHMRSLTITCDSNENVIDSLKTLPNWEFLDGDVPGSHHLLKNGDTKIYLRVVANNIVNTTNVLPQDLSESLPSFHNDVLQTLAEELRKKNIAHSMNISDSDKAKL